MLLEEFLQARRMFMLPLPVWIKDCFPKLFAKLYQII
jgi:hypothetical protein